MFLQTDCKRCCSDVEVLHSVHHDITVGCSQRCNKRETVNEREWNTAFQCSIKLFFKSRAICASWLDCIQTVCRGLIITVVFNIYIKMTRMEHLMRSKTFVLPARCSWKVGDKVWGSGTFSLLTHCLIFTFSLLFGSAPAKVFLFVCVLFLTFLCFTVSPRTINSITWWCPMPFFIPKRSVIVGSSWSIWTRCNTDLRGLPPGLGCPESISPFLARSSHEHTLLYHEKYISCTLGLIWSLLWMM